MVKKHTKPNPEQGITGGVVEQEAAIDLSNLAIWNPKKKSRDKITYSNNDKGNNNFLNISDLILIRLKQTAKVKSTKLVQKIAAHPWKLLNIKVYWSFFLNFNANILKAILLVSLHTF